MTPGAWRRGRCLGSRADDQVVVADRVVAGGEFQQPVEHQAAAAGAAAVETERELVEVPGQVRLIDPNG